MVKINSRSKGNRGERMACEWFKKWTGKDFSRNPASGGLHWKKSNVTGDITCTIEGVYVPFTIEVKNYNNINFSHLLTGVNSDILQFWEQSVTDAKRINKIPLLMMRYNHLPKNFFFFVLSKQTVSILIQNSELTPLFSKLTSLEFSNKKHNLVIYDSREILKDIPYKITKNLLKTHLKKHGKKTKV